MVNTITTVPALTVTLDGPGAHDAALTGAKGAALARMRTARLPVPAGFVVTTGAFTRATAGWARGVADLLAKVDGADLEALERICPLAQRLLVEDPMPEEIAAAIRGAYVELGGGPVSVRSSATAEDLPGLSFAGQYDSVLNVVGEEAVLAAVQQVWASLHAPRAVAYRRQQGITDDGVLMAVVVQRLVLAEASGVLFTCDPVSGATDRIAINAAFGLGEGVVAGAVPADSIMINTRTGEIVTAQIARKDGRVEADPAGGLRRVAVEVARHEEWALGQEQVTALHRLSAAVVELFGGPQDIEFAVAGEEVHLLQARPVTAIAPAPEFPVEWENPTDAAYGWVLRTFNPGPVFRLQEDAERRLYEGGRVCFADTGAPMTRNSIVQFINGYMYLRPLPGTPEEIGARMRRHVGRAEELFDQGTTFYDVEILPELHALLDSLRLSRPRRPDLPALVTHLERAIVAYGHVIGDLHWRMASANLSKNPRDAVSLGDWPKVFHELTGEPEFAGTVFLQAVPNDTMVLVRRMRALARLVQADPLLTEIFRSRAYDRLDAAELKARPGVQAFRARFRALLRKYGQRSGRGFGSMVNFLSPTWNMRPEQPLDLIGDYAKQNLDQLESLERAAAEERRRAVRRLRRRLQHEPAKLARFERAYRIATEDLARVENHNHLMEQATCGHLREAVDAVGRYMVQTGRLDRADDVVHFSLDELRTLAAGEGPDDPRALARERAAERERRLRMRPPATVGDGPAPVLPAATMYALPPGVGREGSLLRGVAASRGTVTGRARVVKPGMSPPRMERGDVLVARNAGPDWTPVFPLLAGIVLDEGAIFQHAALVAREYRIPAVILTRDATSTVEEGQMITVDGDAGIVHLTP